MTSQYQSTAPPEQYQSTNPYSPDSSLQGGDYFRDLAIHGNPQQQSAANSWLSRHEAPSTPTSTTGNTTTTTPPPVVTSDTAANKIGDINQHLGEIDKSKDNQALQDISNPKTKEDYLNNANYASEEEAQKAHDFQNTIKQFQNGEVPLTKEEQAILDNIQ